MKPSEDDEDVPTAEAAKRAIARTREVWPAIVVSESEFCGHLSRVGADGDAVVAQGPDLVLACACARGDEAALSLFERLHVTKVALYVARLQLSPERLEDLRQLVRIKLFTGGAPRILRYAGKGPLGAWVRMLSLRVAMDEIKARVPEEQLDTRILESIAVTAAPAEEHSFRITWGPHLEEAVEMSLAELPARDKTILRLHYVEGLNIDAIGRTYRVHRATVARWLLAIRARVLRKVGERIAMRVPSTTSEIRSAFSALASDLYVSVSRVLGGLEP